ncbi:MAG: S26 family signal peptidase, partial [Muribaculaceae bacterium]|nr:S26 family signal peptidase [Muribaculaceae bacterium]
MTDMMDKKGGESFLDRLRKVKVTRWVRFGIVSAIYIFWVVLMGNPWLLLGWLLLADIYITGFVPWGWWKKKKGLTRTLMAWADAIVYALVLIYFVFAFIGQQYEIPSSSLEKTLLVGDRLWVDKASFGARVPQTPFHFPLAQHTMPIIGGKSYFDSPQLSYHRLPGLRSIGRGDIVVFNYPQGDTVAVKIPNPDYYQISYELRKNGIEDPLAYIKSNPQMFGEVVVRPVDRRENYVKRTIGLPGERIRIVNDTIFINGKAIAEPADVQYNYLVPVSGRISDEKWKELGVRLEDAANGPEVSERAGFRYYDIPLTTT